MRRWTCYLILFLAVLFALVRAYGNTAIKYVGHQRAWIACGSHALSPAEPVYDETPAGAAALSKKGEAYGVPPKVLFDLPGNRPPPGWTTPIEYHPPRLWKLDPGFPQGGVAFLHKRTSPGQRTVLVVVTIESTAWGNNNRRSLRLAARCMEPPQWGRDYIGNHEIVGRHWIRVSSDLVRVFAGQPDQERPDKFTLEIDINGSRRLIEGQLCDRDPKNGHMTEWVKFTPLAK